jgi:two-component system sensor histidine kinase AlgZ
VDRTRDNPASIKQPAILADVPPGPLGLDIPRRRASDRPSIDAVPDWCNLGITLRVAISVNALFFGVVGAGSRTWRGWLGGCLDAAANIEPILLASLLFGCLLRRSMTGLPQRWQVGATLVLPALLTILLEAALGPLIGLDAGLLWRDALVAAALCGGILYWAYLRSQSNLPALAEARLQALQARIRPHFLFNSLNAVLGLIRTDPKRAESILEDLADLFRVLLRDPRERVRLADEIALCRQYLDIESLRLGDRLDVQFNVDPAATTTVVPLLLLQPLIENAVHHGIEPSAASGRITLDVARKGSFVEILISNPWLGEGAARPGNQMALENVRQRLHLLYDLEGQLSTTVRDARFEVRMRLPFMTEAA